MFWKKDNIKVKGEVAILDPTSKFYEYSGFMAKVVTLIAVVWALFQLYYSSYGIMTAIQLRAWYLGFLTVLIFMLFPASKNSKRIRKMPGLWDIFCIIAAILSIGYFITNYYVYIVDRGGLHIPLDYWFGALGILVIFEASRRAAGNALTILAAIFLLYNFFGSYLTGVFGHSGVSVERVINVMWWSSQGIFGSVLGAAVNYIFVFIIFGAFLRKGGFINFINDLALAIAGRSSGGPAKVAVIGSGLMGMVSGSGVANVATTGTITIPLMKKTGYKAHFAGGVESVASTGGLLAPPIMGAAAFIMAEFIGVPYREIMLAALTPAILYFVMCFMSVHFEAKKLGLKGISKENLPKLFEVIRKSGYLIIPVVILIFLLVKGMTPLFAAVWSLLSTVVLSWFKKETRMGIKEIIEALEDGVKGALTVSAACAIVGIVVGTVGLTSIGLTLGNAILSFAGDSLLLVAIFTMFISILLGMGVPPSASYIITATVSAPILMSMGVPILVAHMFAFFFAVLSDITPPVALASLAASGIAREKFIKVVISSLRLGIVGFLIPYFFLFNPVLLFHGDHIFESIVAAITGIIGVVALSAALSSWFVTKVNIIQKLILVIAFFFMLVPNLLTDFMGITLLLLVFSWQLYKKKTVEKEEGGYESA